jgi:hypothetical protein
MNSLGHQCFGHAREPLGVGVAALTSVIADREDDDDLALLTDDGQPPGLFADQPHGIVNGRRNHSEHSKCRARSK